MNLLGVFTTIWPRNKGAYMTKRSVVEVSLNLLGQVMEDRVSNFRGMVSSVSFDAYGCIQVVLSPKLKEDSGDVPDGRWFDVKRLTPTGAARIMDVPDYHQYVPGDEPGPAEKPYQSNRA